jgi:hypothetical protein
MNDKNVKWVILREKYSGRRRVNEDGKWRGKKRVTMVDIFSTHAWIWNTETILRRGRGKRENKGGNAPNWGTLYAYIEMSQRAPPVQLLYTNKNVF